MRRFNISAFVIKSINYGDADKIYTLYSLEDGKISASAKGVRKISSKRAGNLDTLNLVRLKLTELKPDFFSINEVQLINSFQTLKKSYEYTMHAFYILELINKTIDTSEPNKKIFELVERTLSSFDNMDNNPELIVNNFELNLLRHLGYELTFDRCVKCGKKISLDWKKYVFDFDLGGISCDTCAGVGFTLSQKAAFAFLKVLNRNLDMDIDSKTLSDINSLIKAHIRYTFEKDFKSLEISELGN